MKRGQVHVTRTGWLNVKVHLPVRSDVVAVAGIELSLGQQTNPSLAQSQSLEARAEVKWNIYNLQ